MIQNDLFMLIGVKECIITDKNMLIDQLQKENVELKKELESLKPKKEVEQDGSKNS